MGLLIDTGKQVVVRFTKCVAAAESLDREFAARVEGARPDDLHYDDPGIGE